MKPYALAESEGRSYRWHDVVFTMKAAAAETGGAFALWEITTRPGEEPHPHVHDDVDEIFYVLEGAITFHCGGKDFPLQQHGFVFLPRGIEHTYTIEGDPVRLIGISSPSAFGDNIESTGDPIPSR